MNDGLKPQMASRRLRVLAFVRDYIDRWGESPSYGEIAAGCGVGRSNAHQLVSRLVRAGLLMRRPGPRGLSLPSERDEAVRRLRRLGWEIDEDNRRVRTDSTLLPAPALDYVPADAGDGDGKKGSASPAEGERGADPGDQA